MGTLIGARNSQTSNLSDNYSAREESASGDSLGQTTAENLAGASTTAEALASRPTTADILSEQHGGTEADTAYSELSTDNTTTDGSSLQLEAPLASEADASASIETLYDAFSDYQDDGDKEAFQNTVAEESVHARLGFVEQLASFATNQVMEGVNPHAHAINLVLRTLPEAEFIESMDGLSQSQREAVLSDFVDVSVQQFALVLTRTSHSPGGLVAKIGEVVDIDARARLLSQQLTQLRAQPQHATATANAIVADLDAQTFGLLTEPAIEVLALSVADSNSEAITDALVRLGSDGPSMKYSLFARTLLTRIDKDVLTIFNPHTALGNNSKLQSVLADALAYKPGQSSVETEQNAQAIQEQLSTVGGREFLLGDGILGADRIFALNVITDHPELLVSGESGESSNIALWQSEGVNKLYAEQAFSRFSERGSVGLSVTDGNIDNYLGVSLGLVPSNNDDALQMLAQNQSVFQDNEVIQPIADEIRDLQASEFSGQPVTLSTIPILYSSNESGPVQLQVYRVEANGVTRYVDNVGRSYDSIQNWKENNQLPSGQVTYAENFETGGNLVSEVTHQTVDTWGEKILSVADKAALVGGVVASGIIILGSGGTATPLVAGAWVVAGGTAAYTGYRAGGELVDRAEFGQTLNPMQDAGARAAWLSLGASALTVGGGGLARLSTVAETGSTAASVAGRTSAVFNTGANYVDAAATVDTAHGVISNWDQLSSSERAQGILEVAFWGGMTGVSARASGGNVSDAFNLRIQVAQADISSGRAVNENPSLTDGAVSVVHSTDAAGNRTVEVQHAPDATPAEIDIHTNVARELASNQALNGGMYRTLTGEHRFMPGTRAEEVHFEVSKHELLVEYYESAVSAGAGDLAPRLEELRLDLAVYRGVQSAHQQNPELASADGIGEIDASPRYSPNKAHVTSAEARAAFEPVDGKFDSFDRYKIAVRADWKPLANTTYELEGIKVTTDQLGRPQLVEGTVDPDRAVGRISRFDTALGNQAGAMDTDIGFHLGADQLGFMGGPLNVVPGDRTLNNSDYKRLENKLRGFHDEGRTVDVEFSAVYNPGNSSQRPDGFEVRYSLNGVSTDIQSFTNDGTKI